MDQYLKNSTRSLYKATFEAKNKDKETNGNVVEKTAFVNDLNPSSEDLNAVKSKIATMEASEKNKINSAIEVLKPMVATSSSMETLKLATKLSEIDSNTLVKVGRILSELKATGGTTSSSAKLKNKNVSVVAKNAKSKSSDEILDATLQFESRMAQSKYGWLHLERMDMKPSGTTQEGELLYSLPLAPNEKVILTHREWSSQSKDLEKMVSDVIETSEEQSVEDKRDAAMSTETQSQVSTAFAVSGGYSGFGVSFSSNFTRSTDDKVSQKVSEQHSTNITKKASAKARKEHKTMFKVSSASGIEDSSERILENKFSDHVLQLDYHRQMREWDVSLTRFGMRLAYDIVIPNPAKDIVEKHMEIKKIDDELSRAFSFDLLPELIDFENNGSEFYYLKLAKKYGVSINAPKVEIASPKTYTMPTRSDNDTQYGLIEMDIPPNHSIKKISVQSIFTTNDSDHLRYLNFSHPQLQDKYRFEHAHDGGPDNQVFMIPIEEKYEEIFVGVRDKLVINFTWASFRDLKVVLKAILQLDRSVVDQFKLEAWQKLNVAAFEQYEHYRGELEEKKAKLLEEISSDDALALRGREREEVMKRILSWFFGFNFSNANPSLPRNMVMVPASSAHLLDAYTSTENMENETEVSGEIIKFLSQAIEWENVVYVLYPYFWANKENRKYKMFLHHPDKMHRDFLRAGAARVVLTVRRGFENAFINAVENGPLAGLATDHPIVSIANELQIEAWKRYKDMPPEGSSENFPTTDQEEEPKPFASWKEFMPTSGVKVKATKIKVTEE